MACGERCERALSPRERCRCSCHGGSHGALISDAERKAWKEIRWRERHRNIERIAERREAELLDGQQYLDWREA